MYIYVFTVYLCVHKHCMLYYSCGVVFRCCHSVVYVVNLQKSSIRLLAYANLTV